MLTEAPAGQHRFWVKARQWRGGSSHHSASHCYPPLKTPTCTLHQTWPLWRQCFWVNIRTIFETKWQYFTDCSSSLLWRTKIFALYDIWTRQSRLSSLLHISQVCLIEVYSYPTLEATWFTKPCIPICLKIREGKHKVSLLCHMGSEIYGILLVSMTRPCLGISSLIPQARSTALVLCFFWLGPSWLTLPSGCLGLFGLAGSFSWGWEVVCSVFIFFWKDL